eukprot:scaffold30874_cov21-Tisochrysis_lutea.AAC.2
MCAPVDVLGRCPCTADAYRFAFTGCLRNSGCALAPPLHCTFSTNQCYTDVCTPVDVIGHRPCPAAPPQTPHLPGPAARKAPLLLLLLQPCPQWASLLKAHARPLYPCAADEGLPEKIPS